jgi:arsenate reductase-like glutaredoxin family protein
VKDKVDAKKQVIGREAAIALARESTEIVAARGKTVKRLDPRAPGVTDEDIAALVIGPSGNLRAPALRVDGKLVIGFEPGMYQEFFGEP